MLKYLIIQLCKSSVSICNYNRSNAKNLIDLAVLENGLQWAVKRGISPQLVYPTYQLPGQYEALLDNYEHIKIQPYKDGEKEKSDIIVLDGWPAFETVREGLSVPVVFHTNLSDFLDRYLLIVERLHFFVRLNVIFDDILAFNDTIQDSYEAALIALADKIEQLYIQNIKVQLNLLTDRILLDKMNNCNAGVESLTLAPDGNLYICPAFYLNEESSIGNPKSDINLQIQQLYKIEYAPICRKCDAFHCRRCVWLNKKATLEVNTPGRQQCIMAHIERNVSKRLLEKMRIYGGISPNTDIPEINYLDPFDKLIKDNML